MSRPNRIGYLLAIAAIASLGLLGAAGAQTSSPLPKPSPFRLDTTWKLQLPATFKEPGEVIGTEETTDGTLIVLTRCGGRECASSNQDPILKIDKSGKYIKSWGAGTMVWPHGLYVGRDGSVWVTDAVSGPGVKKDDPRVVGKGQTVVKYNADGKVVLTLGKPGVTGSGPDAFNSPTDVVEAPNGDIFVADGHGGPDTNERVVKFSKDGKFIKAWGKYGKGPGEFDGLHAMVMDRAGRVLVADRGNNRIQVFDQDGTFVAEYKQFGRPTDIAVDGNNTLYSTDTQTIVGRPGFQNGIYVGRASDGVVTGFIPKIREHTTSEPGPDGQQIGPGPDRTNMEGLGVLPDGSILYGNEVGLHTVVRFIRNK